MRGIQEPVEENINLEQGGSERPVKIGSKLKEELKQKLMHCL